MIHTASLVHDDILDHAETRRGKESVNVKWDTRRFTMGGDFILAVGSRLLSQVGDKDVVVILSQVLADLVQGSHKVEKVVFENQCEPYTEKTCWTQNKEHCEGK